MLTPNCKLRSSPKIVNSSCVSFLTVKPFLWISFQDGKRYYKVKWESSWECEENLGDYQDLVDQFWDFVKRVSNEEDAEAQSRKRVTKIIYLPQRGFVAWGAKKIRSSLKKIRSSLKKIRSSLKKNVHICHSDRSLGWRSISLYHKLNFCWLAHNFLRSEYSSDCRSTLKMIETGSSSWDFVQRFQKKSFW